MKRLYKHALIAILIPLLFGACEIGLGDMINMLGPVVKIQGPTPDRSSNPNEPDPVVRTLFTLSGTAESQSKVARLIVNIDFWNDEGQILIRMGREFKWEDVWMTRESSDSSWRQYNSSVYEHEIDPDNPEPVGDPSWNKKGNVVSWSLPIFLSRMESGEYFITVSAWDKAGMHDSKSITKLKIRYANDAPKFTVLDPVLQFSDGSSLSAPRPPDYSNYIFDPFGNPGTTNTNLGYFTNDIRTLSWKIEPVAGALQEELHLMLTNQHDLDNPDTSGRKIYYQWDMTSGLPANGTHGFKADGSAGEFPKIEIKPEIVAEFNIPSDKITPMQLISKTIDNNGNTEYKSNGWFLYLPDSDKPYADISFGYKVKAGTAAPSDAAEKASIFRATTNSNNWAYDDDGLKHLYYTVSRLKENSLDEEASFTPVKVEFNGEKRISWTFSASTNYGVGRFKVDVVVTDIYGKESDTYTAYFTIESNARPTIKEFTLGTGTLWGDTNGKFKITGIAQIECKENCDGNNHAVKIDRITAAWIKPGLGSENQARYQLDNDPLWNGGFTNGYKQDSWGNKVWEIDPTSLEWKKYNSATAQDEWEFNLNLSWFNQTPVTNADLNVGKNANQIPSSDQVFRVRVLSNGASNNNPLSSVGPVTTQGDKGEPVIKITSIGIEERRGSELLATSTWEIGKFSLLPSIAKDYRVRINGTWEDDSIQNWSSRNYSDLIKNLTVTWDGEENDFTFQIHEITHTLASSGGTWQTDWITFDKINTDPSVSIIARMADLNDNTGVKEETVIIETDHPQLTRISSSVFDGRYGSFKDTSDTIGSRFIDIFFDFNKPIEFLPSSPALSASNTPYLLLNNGGRAFYSHGNMSNRIVFRYFIDGIVNGIGQLSPNTATANYGGTSTTVLSEGDLNVAYTSTNSDGHPDFEGSLFNTTFPKTNWVSMQGQRITFPNGISAPTNPGSLSVQKNIIIDKDHPTLVKISTTTSNSKPHGRGSQIFLTAEFSEEIRLRDGASSTNLFLELSGGLGRAGYHHVAGEKTINFLYTVPETGSFDNVNLAVSLLRGNNYIIDIAGNAVQSSPSAANNNADDITFTGSIGTANSQPLKIKTTSPSAPSIKINNNTADTGGNRNYYGNVNFVVSSLSGDVGTVEYHLNYSGPSDDNSDQWVAYSGQISGSETNNIPISINGNFNIAARQYDNATNPNRSSVKVINNVKIDKGAILTRLTSSNPDGVYGPGIAGKGTIDIEMEFRIPVTLSGSSTPVPVGTANIQVNVDPSLGNRAELITAPAGSTKWIFRYTIPASESLNVERLDVTAINLDNLTINDANGTKVNGDTGWIKLSDLSVSNRLMAQKAIQILSGRPAVTSIPASVIDAGSTGNIALTTGGTELRFTFNRDIYRGNTTEKLIVRQIADDYRIPAVMTSDKFNDIFSGREDIFTEQSGILTGITWTGGTAASVKAELWKELGDILYEQSSNGATETTTTKLKPDETIKRVLKFDVSTKAVDTENVATLKNGTTVTMGQIRSLFRAAEALSFGVSDKEVSIKVQSPKRLDINLSERGGLPVEGARYEYIFPNGFVKDILDKANGIGGGTDLVPTGKDTNLSTGTITGNDGPRVLNFKGKTEKPVIRINKGNDDHPGYHGSGDNRNVYQPLTTTFTVDGRTPGSEITFSKRETKDSVRQIMNRSGISGTTAANFKLLPNLGTHENGNNAAAGQKSFEDTRLRPQSGGGSSPITGVSWTASGTMSNTTITTAKGLYHFTAMVSTWTATTDTTIGSTSYNDGGMEINIKAVAKSSGNTDSDDAYEAAYRSVLVFDNQTANSKDLGGAGASSRVWVRGGNTTDGDPTIPDFPISRNPELWKKVKLMTPIENGKFTSNTNSVTDSDVSTDTAKNRLWFWVTWRINVPAFVDLHTGDLPTSATGYPAPRDNIKQFFKAWVPSKEHYAVHPGRTTVVESRDSYDSQWDGGHGNLDFTSAKSPASPTDMTAD